jgi:hypothetical protein
MLVIVLRQVRARVISTVHAWPGPGAAVPCGTPEPVLESSQGLALGSSTHQRRLAEAFTLLGSFAKENNS